MNTIEIEIFGIRCDVTQLTEQSCACGRAAECGGLRLTDLAHVCWDVKNACGNAHVDRVNGGYWVEWHFDFCFDRENHLEEWLVAGRATMVEYEAYLDSLTHQERSNGNRRSRPRNAHAFVPLRSMEWWLTQPAGVAAYARHQDLAPEIARLEIQMGISRILAKRIVSASQVRLNHDILERYTAHELLRFWPGEFDRLAALEPSPNDSIRLIRDGREIELRTGSLPALREFQGLPPMPGQLKPVEPKMLE